MKINSRIRRIADYMAATENEIAIDENFLRLISLTPAHTGYLPRAPKWVTLGQRAPFFTRMLWHVLWVMWVLGGGVLYFLHEMSRHWKQAVPGSPPLRTGLPGGAILATSSRTASILNPAQFPGLPRTWYTVPWVQVDVIPSDATRINLFSQLGRADLYTAFADAVLATYLVLRRRRTRKWLLQTYTAFRWFAVRAAIDKHPRGLVITEHFDRWAVLADSAARAFKLRLPEGEQLTLVQHGSLAKLGNDDQVEPLKLYRRLRAVTHLHAYGDEAVSVFKSDLLSSHCRVRVKVDTFTPMIELKGERQSNRVRVLFVGYPLCEEFHQTLYAALVEKFDLIAFYKPHPRAPMSEAMRAIGWTVVDDPTWFPAVELLISYQSTLVIEYANCGVPAEVHPIHVGKDDVEAFLPRASHAIEAAESVRQPQASPL